MCFLLAEDEIPLSRALTKSLAARGHQVDQVTTARDAVNAANLGRYDLMLLDVNLPDATGWDVLRELRAADRSIPTIVLSAVPPSVQRVREFRPEGVLTKPFPIEALLRLVSRIQEDRPS